ncbi:Thymidine kinase [Trichinella spiralis]|uniref:Thymidine kinase n=1 Tax=Trichinella spiralis TaxID=6334 RepID=A0ABR3K6J1_TRISP
MKLENANALSQLPQTGKPNMCSGPLEVLLLESTPDHSNTSVTSCLLNDHSESETIKQLMILFLAAALSICNKSRRDSHAQLLSPAQELLHQSSIANLIRSNTVSDCSVTTKAIS